MAFRLLNCLQYVVRVYKYLVISNSRTLIKFNLGVSRGEGGFQYYFRESKESKTEK